MFEEQESWGGCGRHLSLGTSSKVAIDGPFEAVLGKTHRTEFSRGKGKPEARWSPPGALLPYSAQVNLKLGLTTQSSWGFRQRIPEASEPFVTRIYKTDDNDQILKKQPRGYPFTITEDYDLGENEKAQVHKGVDITSRPAPNEPARLMDLKAGVYGVVVRAGGGDWGTISVQLRDGSVIQYLHTTASHVKVGDVVAPDTLLGVTGRTGARDIHLRAYAPG